MSAPRFFLLRGLVTIYMAFVAAIPAWGCSTCLSGDPTLTAMGSEKAYAGRWRVSVEYLQRRETIGHAGHDLHKLKEWRATTALAYALSDRSIIAMRMPYVDKDLSSANLAQERGSGAGDLELSLRQQLWQDRGLRPRHISGIFAGARIPTGTEIKANGNVLDLDVQPGTGAWVPRVGVWYGWYNYPRFGYASAVYHHPGVGFQDFEAGDAVTTTLKYQHALNFRLALQLGMDARWAQRDRYAGVVDANSGGIVAFAVPGLVFALATDVLLHLDGQIPWLDQLHGEHGEGASFRLGMTYDF